MTLAVVFEALKEGKITLEDRIPGERECLAHRRRTVRNVGDVRAVQYQA